MLLWPSMATICLRVCIWGRLSASLLTWRTQFQSSCCSLTLPGWVSSGPVSSLLGMNRHSPLFQTSYQPLWIDMTPEIATFTGQNLHKLKEGRIGLTGKNPPLPCAADGARSGLDLWSFSPSLPEFVARMSPHGKGESEKVCGLANLESQPRFCAALSMCHGKKMRCSLWQSNFAVAVSLTGCRLASFGGSCL